MSNNNLKIAEEYSKRMKAMTNKVWVSDNLPTLPSEERRAILKVYRKHFHTVDYDPATGICKCWVVDPIGNELTPEELEKGAEIVAFDRASPNTTANQPVSQQTREHLGMKADSGPKHIWIDDSDKFPEVETN